MRAAGYLLALLPLLMNGQTPPCKSTVTGQLEIFPLKSQVFANTRNLRVWLPPGYADPRNASRLYPVLYMLDGQILFDSCTDGGPEWKIDETLTRLIEAGTLDPLIVVGIDFAGKRRAYEFLPWRDTVFSPASPAPAGQWFPDFLADEVLPLIAGKYRVQKGPQAIGGASYGAVAVLYAVLMRPDLFGSVLLESPSLAVGNGQFLRDTEHVFKGPSRVYLGIGGMESGGKPNSAENLGYIAMVRTLEHNLKSITVDPPELLTVVQPEGTHMPATWAARFARAITFLYPKK